MQAYRADLVIPANLPLVPGAGGPEARGVVRRLQEWLVVRGYDCGINLDVPAGSANAVGIDGGFGPATQRAVEAFATANGLRPVVDREFWNRLILPLVQADSFRPKAREIGAAIVEVAQAFLIARPREARDQNFRGADNSGPWVRYVCGGAEVEWCQGIASRITNAAAQALGVETPFPLDGGGIRPLWVPDIVASAERAGKLRLGETIGTVPPGSMFFVRGTGAIRWKHVGIVERDLGAGKIATLEGNTWNDGTDRGIAFIARERFKSNLDFGVPS